MSNTTVKLQIPLDKTLRDRVAKLARAQGFSSIQDYTRVLFSTAVDQDMRFSLTPRRNEHLSPKAEARYKRMLAGYEKDKKAGRIKSFDNIDDFLADLNS